MGLRAIYGFLRVIYPVPKKTNYNKLWASVFLQFSRAPHSNGKIQLRPNKVLLATQPDIGDLICGKSGRGFSCKKTDVLNFIIKMKLMCLIFCRCVYPMRNLLFTKPLPQHTPNWESPSRVP